MSFPPRGAADPSLLCAAFVLDCFGRILVLFRAFRLVVFPCDVLFPSIYSARQTISNMNELSGEPPA
jgi:hypothetical protein